MLKVSVSSPQPTAKKEQAQSSISSNNTASNTPSAPLQTTGKQLTITGSGDILIHDSIWYEAQRNSNGDGPNFAPALAGVKKLISGADYSICHNETAFSQIGNITSFPHYYVHPNLAKGIAKTGFDDCSTASNWTFDKGMAGIRRTVNSLNAAGVNQSGANVSKEASDNRIVIRDVKGVKLVHLSYTDPGDSPGVPGKSWAVNRQSPAQIAVDAHKAREMGAQIVIVSLAMGEMGPTETNSHQRAAVKTITAGHDVSFIIGHGSHTTQPAEKVNGTWVVWHGNLLAAFYPDERRMHEGLVSKVTFTQQPDQSWAATKVVGYPVLTTRDPVLAVDMSDDHCDVVPDRWREAYSSIKSIESDAIKDGFILRKPCQG